MMSVCSKNPKLGTSTEAASAQLLERAQLLLALNEIDGPNF
jgi:hypothetical protein